MAKSAASSRGVEARLSARLSAKAKADEVWPGVARTYELAKKYKIKTAWGSDVLFSQALAQQQGAILASAAAESAQGMPCAPFRNLMRPD